MTTAEEYLKLHKIDGRDASDEYMYLQYQDVLKALQLKEQEFNKAKGKGK